MNIRQLLERLAILSASAEVREKSNRTICYVLKLVEFKLQQYSPLHPSLKPIKSLQNIISEARRVYRLCKYFENIQSVLKAAKMTNWVMKYSAMGKHTSMFFHHSLDQLILLRSAGFLTHLDIDLIKKRCLMSWLFSVIFGIAGITYQILTDMQTQKTLQQRLERIKREIEIQHKEYEEESKGQPMELSEFAMKTREERSRVEKEIGVLESKRRVLYVEFLKAFFDLPVAFEVTYKKNYLRSDAVSFCGVLSSLLGLYLVLPKAPSPSVVVVKSS